MADGSRSGPLRTPASLARRPGARARVLGHRGAMALCPENSEASFLRAVQDGADGVELDVRLSADDELVVFHDADLARLAGRPERARALPWSELAALALRGGARIPRLAEVLWRLPDGFMLNVEIKADGEADDYVTAIVDRTWREIEPCRQRLPVVVSSFDPRVLAAWQRCGADAPFGMLFEDALPEVLPRVAALHPHHALCTPARVAVWRAAGYAVNVWTVDEPGRARALAAMGVDAIIGNDPGALRVALG